MRFALRTSTPQTVARIAVLYLATLCTKNQTKNQLKNTKRSLLNWNYCGIPALKVSMNFSACLLITLPVLCYNSLLCYYNYNYNPLTRTLAAVKAN